MDHNRGGLSVDFHKKLGEWGGRIGKKNNELLNSMLFDTMAAIKN